MIYTESQIDCTTITDVDLAILCDVYNINELRQEELVETNQAENVLLINENIDMIDSVGSHTIFFLTLGFILLFVIWLYRWFFRF